MVLHCLAEISSACFLFPQPCISHTAAVISFLLFCSDFKEEEGSHFLFRVSPFSLAENPFCHLHLRHGASSFSCLSCHFIFILASLSPNLPPLPPPRVKDFLSRHFFKFTLYLPGVSLLSYMCQDLARTVG